MSEHELTDLIYKAEQEVSSKDKQREAASTSKVTHQAAWPLGFVIVVLIASLAWNAARIHAVEKVVPSQDSYQMSLMILADSLVTEAKHSGNLPSQLTGPLATELPVDYLKLNASDFELSLETGTGKLILRHEFAMDEISFYPH